MAQQLRSKLSLNAAVVQLPIGLEDRLSVRLASAWTRGARTCSVCGLSRASFQAHACCSFEMCRSLQLQHAPVTSVSASVNNREAE